MVVVVIVCCVYCKGYGAGPTLHNTCKCAVLTSKVTFTRNLVSSTLMLVNHSPPQTAIETLLELVRPAVTSPNHISEIPGGYIMEPMPLAFGSSK